MTTLSAYEMPVGGAVGQPQCSAAVLTLLSETNIGSQLADGSGPVRRNEHHGRSLASSLAPCTGLPTGAYLLLVGRSWWELVGVDCWMLDDVGLHCPDPSTATAPWSYSLCLASECLQRSNAPLDDNNLPANTLSHSITSPPQVLLTTGLDRSETPVSARGPRPAASDIRPFLAGGETSQHGGAEARARRLQATASAAIAHERGPPGLQWPAPRMQIHQSHSIILPAAGSWTVGRLDAGLTADCGRRSEGPSHRRSQSDFGGS